nr:N-acetylneuraminate synthase family protein [Campylobacter sp.]
MFKHEICIDKIKIGNGNSPYIIAEMSANHGHDLEKAKLIIKEAKKAGASAVKIQTYTADTITLNSKKPEFMAGGAWSGQSLYELYQDAYTPWEWTDELVKTAKELDITLFSSPFDYS